MVNSIWVNIPLFTSQVYGYDSFAIYLHYHIIDGMVK